MKSKPMRIQVDMSMSVRENWEIIKDFIEQQDDLLMEYLEVEGM